MPVIGKIEARAMNITDKLLPSRMGKEEQTGLL